MVPHQTQGLYASLYVASRRTEIAGRTVAEQFYLARTGVATVAHPALTPIPGVPNLMTHTVMIKAEIRPGEDPILVMLKCVDETAQPGDTVQVNAAGLNRTYTLIPATAATT